MQFHGRELSAKLQGKETGRPPRKVEPTRGQNVRADRLAVHPQRRYLSLPTDTGFAPKMQRERLLGLVGRESQPFTRLGGARNVAKLKLPEVLARHDHPIRSRTNQLQPLHGQGGGGGGFVPDFGDGQRQRRSGRLGVEGDFVLLPGVGVDGDRSDRLAVVLHADLTGEIPESTGPKPQGRTAVKDLGHHPAKTIPAQPQMRWLKLHEGLAFELSGKIPDCRRLKPLHRREMDKSTFGGQPGDLPVGRLSRSLRPQLDVVAGRGPRQLDQSRAGAKLLALHLAQLDGRRFS